MDDMHPYVSAPNKTVCFDCIGDTALAEFISSKKVDAECDYCNASKLSLKLQDVCEHMFDLLSEDWGSPEQVGMVRDSGEWIGGDLYETDYVLACADFEPSVDGLMDDVVSAFSSLEFAWASTYQVLLNPDEVIEVSWEAFCREVKHSRRFTFWDVPTCDEGVAIGQFLDDLGAMVTSLNLLKVFNEETQYWRGHGHETASPIEKSAKRFGTAPVEFAKQPNRMSPAGIPMFYGAEDVETALHEVFHKDHEAITSGVFKPAKPLLLLDLTEIPDKPSYFDSSSSSAREAISFLRRFVGDVSKTISEGDELVEYVPTQAFTEYVRYKLSGADKQPLNGIRFSSSKTGKPCVVLFVLHGECINGSYPEQLLVFDKGSIRTDTPNKTGDAVTFSPAK